MGFDLTSALPFVEEQLLKDSETTTAAPTNSAVLLKSNGAATATIARNVFGGFCWNFTLAYSSVKVQDAWKTSKFKLIEGYVHETSFC